MLLTCLTIPAGHAAWCPLNIDRTDLRAQIRHPRAPRVPADRSACHGADRSRACGAYPLQRLLAGLSSQASASRFTSGVEQRSTSTKRLTFPSPPQLFSAADAHDATPNQEWFCGTCRQQDSAVETSATAHRHHHTQEDADHMPTMLCDTCGGEFTWDLSTAFDLALAVSYA